LPCSTWSPAFQEGEIAKSPALQICTKLPLQPRRRPLNYCSLKIASDGRAEEIASALSLGTEGLIGLSRANRQPRRCARIDIVIDGPLTDSTGMPFPPRERHPGFRAPLLPRAGLDSLARAGTISICDPRMGVNVSNGREHSAGGWIASTGETGDWGREHVLAGCRCLWRG
jgi:hypothetical protein